MAGAPEGSVSVVLYAYNDLPDLREQHLAKHREFLAGLPNLLLSGPTDDGSAVIVLDGDPAEVEQQMDADPFRAVGLIKERRVVAWTPVLGSWKATLGL